MGLDLVEYMMALENAFGIDIPDADAEHLETPRLVADYLARRLPVAATAVALPCLSQRAFYRVRSAAVRRFGGSPRAVRPDTRLRAVLGARAGEWKSLGRDLGARRWPQLKAEHRFARLFQGVTTFGDVARHLTQYNVASLRGPDLPWTREEIERVVVQLLEAETGVDMRKHTLDSRFTRDMGID